MFGFGQNAPPVLSGDFALEVSEGGSVAIAAGDLAASDGESGPSDLSFAVTSTLNGFVAFAADLSTPITSLTQADLDGGLVVFVNDGSDTAVAGFDAVVTDGNGASSGAPQSVTVSVAAVEGTPVAVDDAAETDEDVAAPVAVLANDTDPDGGPIGVASFTQGAFGSVSEAGGVLTYTPNADANGVDTFIYTLTPGGSGATDTVTVNPVNAPLSPPRMPTARSLRPSWRSRPDRAFWPMTAMAKTIRSASTRVCRTCQTARSW